jgi:hypothetical protein
LSRQMHPNRMSFEMFSDKKNPLMQPVAAWAESVMAQRKAVSASRSRHRIGGVLVAGPKCGRALHKGTCSACQAESKESLTSVPPGRVSGVVGFCLGTLATPV